MTPGSARVYDLFLLTFLFLISTQNEAWIYKGGSMTQSFNAKSLAIPSLRLVGLLPSDVEKCPIPLAARIPLSQDEKSLISRLLENEALAHFPQWMSEINLLQQRNFKTQIEGLSTVLQTDYLRYKLANGLYI